MLKKLGCACRSRAPTPKVSGPVCDGHAAPQSEYEKWFKDPLMGAASAADAELAGELKEQGNEKFKNGLFMEALNLYNEAVQLQSRNPSLWLNRSTANRQLQRWEDAAEDAELARALQPDNVKAYYSHALCMQNLGKYQDGLNSCRDGLKVQADNKALLQLQNVLKRTLHEEKHPTKEATPKDGSPENAIPSTTASGEEASSTGSETRKKGSGEPRRRKRPLTAEQKEQRRLSATAATVDGAACPATYLDDSAVADIKESASKKMYEWKNREPSLPEREALKQMMTDMFLGKYKELQHDKEKHGGGKIPTDQYDKEQKLGLQLKGGHQPMDRPENVVLPANYKAPLGVVTLDQLKKYSHENKDGRYMICVYGNIFDVSDRPDKYGPDGPYLHLTGADITWGLFTGVDTVDFVNRFYDLFKAKDMGKDKLGGVCSWLAWYWNEYGEPVGKLDIYMRENELPAPPLEEVDDACCIM